MKAESNSAGGAYIQTVTAALHAKLESAPRGKRIRENLDFHLRIHDLRQNIIVSPWRKLNYRFMVAEWLWILTGREDVEFLARYNSKMREFSDDQKTLAGAYGPRWVSQVTHIINTLRADRDSRQSVATIWTPNPAPSKDIPCTISLQFLIRNEKLNCVATMRSSDVWLGLPYDIFVFSQLANYIAGVVDAEPGFLSMNFGSSHLYEEHWDEAQKFVDAYNIETVRSPALGGWIPPMLRGFLEQADTSADPLLDAAWLRYAEVLETKTSEGALTCLRS